MSGPPDRLLAILADKLREIDNEKKLNAQLFGKAAYVAEQIKAGKLEGARAEAERALVGAVVDTGLVTRERALRSFASGWSKGGGGEAVPRKELPPLREVQHSVTTAALPMDVHQSVDLLLAVLSDARVKNKVASLILDALEVFEVSKSRKPGDAA